MSEQPYVSRTAGMYAPRRVKGDYKRIILCCDGTWQAVDKGYRSVPSNVVKFSRAIDRVDKQMIDGQEREIQQVVYYQSGVATGNSGSWARKFYGNLGIGLDQNVVSAYYFLSNNFDPEDEILLFGFSRGAYTVRIISDLIAKFGVIQKEHIDRFPILYEAYTKRVNDEDFYKTFGPQLGQFASHKTKVKVIGVWDTVGSMGAPSNWPWWIAQPLEQFAGYEKREFRDATLSSNVEHAFHAVGLDEHRQPFSPAMWHLPAPVAGETQPELIQCWFPGVHINVGGGNSDNRVSVFSTEDAAAKLLDTPDADYKSFLEYNPKTDLENLADITFAWMIDLCLPYLAFDLSYVMKLERAMDSMIKSATEQHPKPLREYASGPITDSYSSSWGWALGGSAYRRPKQYNERNVYDAELISSDTNEFIHPSVRVRTMILGKEWSPPALEEFKKYEDGVVSKQTTNIVYRKQLPNGKLLEIPEWRTKKREWTEHGERSAEEMWMGGSVMNNLKIVD